MNEIWIFNGKNSVFPSATFDSKDKAEVWIQTHKLSGVLTKYPINISVYDWAIENNYFKPKKDADKTAHKIQGFSSAHLEHYHYQNGALP